MLTTKNRAGIGQTGILMFGLAWWLAGCTPAGPRALLEGARLLDAGKIEEATAYLERAVQRIPQNAQAWNHLGVAYHRSGRLDYAARAYQQALVLQHDLAPARFNLGCLELERGDSESAIRDLSAYLGGQPKSTVAWLKLGSAYLRTRQPDNAEQCFRQALQLDPELPEAINGLGLVQIQRRRYPEAYQQFQTATRAQPGYIPALRNAAIVAQQYLKNKPVALERYQDLLSLPAVPESESIQLLAAQLQNELNPLPPAQPTLAQVAPKPETSTPSNADQHPLVNAPSSSLTNSVPASAPEPTAATPTNPAPVTLSISTNASNPNLARSVIHEPPPTISAERPAVLPPQQAPKRNENARQVEQRPVPSEPAANSLSPFPRYRYRVQGSFKSGDRAAASRLVEEGYQAHTRYRFSDAIDLYQQAIQSDPSFFDARYNLGVAAYENGDLALALSAYEAALAIQPESLKARFNFASTLEQAGYPQDAADELEKLVLAHPDEVRIQASLANLYARKLGDPRRARTHYLRVLELDPRYPEATAIRYWLESHR